MALGFIKKIFSFGKKEVEEVPVEKLSGEVDQLPTAEQLYEDTTAQEALNVPAETIPAQAEPVVEEQTVAFEDTAAEPELLQDIEPVIVEQTAIKSSPVDELIEATDEIESPMGEVASSRCRSLPPKHRSQSLEAPEPALPQAIESNC